MNIKFGKKFKKFLLNKNMKILLLYKGYPRISQSYQIDEAQELNKENQLMIISFDWEVLKSSFASLPYLKKNPLDSISEIKFFKPDFIHSHYLDTIEICDNISRKINKKYSIRTHSFDILTTDEKLLSYKRYVNSENCNGIIVFPEFKSRLISLGYNENKIYQNYPSLYIHRFLEINTNGGGIMSGGAMLPKKNIESFIELSIKIKNKYPSKQINYYCIIDDQDYYKKIDKINNAYGKPVNFISEQIIDMPNEYKKHEWLIYTACPKLRTVGLPMMVAEAQASGVGVIMYKLRDTLLDYVTENGYLYETDDEILEIISNDFDETKRKNAKQISIRYDIRNNIKQLKF